MHMYMSILRLSLMDTSTLLESGKALAVPTAPAPPPSAWQTVAECGTAVPAARTWEGPAAEHATTAGPAVFGPHIFHRSLHDFTVL